MYSFKAVIFDLDGVVTKTAMVHSRSWKKVFDEYLQLAAHREDKPFRVFTEDDYLKYVDGKPRYQGVDSFLKSRDINLSWGNPQDKPGNETVCGIGNKKNDKFIQIIESQGVEAYASTVEFINKLKSRGIKVGVASSSKNCKSILEGAGLGNLFQTRVDGETSAELGLKGKPAGDIFVRAAYNLGVLPGCAVVVEDASSGVEAGRNGGFGLVHGIARKNNTKDLLSHYADVVVSDLSSIDIEWIERWFHIKPYLFARGDKISSTGDKQPVMGFAGNDNEIDLDGQDSELPPEVNIVRDKLSKNGRSDDTSNEIDIRLSSGDISINNFYSRDGGEILCPKKKIVFFLDYDGTLTPIVRRPELAVLSPGMKEVLSKLVLHYTVAIVSGRLRDDVEKLVGIEGILYAGSHGFDIRGPSFSLVHPQAQEAVGDIKKIVKTIKEGLGDIKGILIEDKEFSVGVHYRLVGDSDLARIRGYVDGIVKKHNNLRLMLGKKVFEILPAIDWNKGKALCWIMKALNLTFSEATVIYIGDDTTDEDAFRVIRTRGTGILVADNARVSTADFRLSSPAEVKALFERVLK